MRALDDMWLPDVDSSWDPGAWDELFANEVSLSKGSLLECWEVFLLLSRNSVQAFHM